MMVGVDGRRGEGGAGRDGVEGEVIKTMCSPPSSKWVWLTHPVPLSLPREAPPIAGPSSSWVVVEVLSPASSGSFSSE